MMKRPLAFARCLPYGALLLAMLLLVAPALAQPAAPELPAGINDTFLDPDLDPAEFVGRFERDGREAYAARNAILDALQIAPGMQVADIGAGTGLFTVLFADSVGDEGWVYAVDIAPRLIEHIAHRADQAGLENITPVVCSQRSANLPPESIDLAFICDTYHHFEHPAETLRSIHQALRPGGRLVIVDFERIEGVSSDWILGHVRAGKEVFSAEIQSAGFRLEAEPVVEGLEENYLRVFRKQP